jgi:TonB family protein
MEPAHFDRGPPSDGEAKAISRATPEYPSGAAADGIQGCVVTSFVILPDGNANEFAIVDSVPAGTFDKAALRALLKWRFEQPPRPGRYATAISFAIEASAESPIRPLKRQCKPIPSFAELNSASFVSIGYNPVPLTRYSPIYPRAAMLDGTQGCVVVSFTVQPDGSVDAAKVDDAEPAKIFDDATVAAVQRWRFEEGVKPTRYSQYLTYDLDSSFGSSRKPMPARCAELELGSKAP